MRACVRACVRACMRACVRACVWVATNGQMQVHAVSLVRAATSVSSRHPHKLLLTYIAYIASSCEAVSVFWAFLWHSKAILHRRNDACRHCI